MALYSIFKYYCLDADLLNIPINVMLKSKNKLSIDDSEVIDCSSLLYDLGIISKWISLNNKQEIISVLKRAIDMGAVAICRIDCYFYSQFHALYHTAHSVHGVPIFGYDTNRQIFNTIDSNYYEDFSKIPLDVSFDDIADSTIGFGDFKKMPNVQIIKKDPHINGDNLLIRKKYVNIFASKINDILKNCDFIVHGLDDTINYIKNWYSDPDKMMSFCWENYPTIDKFINARMLEFYGIPRVFVNIDDLQKLNLDTVNRLNLIRGVMYRTIYAREYREKSFEKVLECFQKIDRNERQRIHFMCNFNWENNIGEVK